MSVGILAKIDIGTAAQWAAVATALAMGTRAEIRAFRDKKRERTKDTATAFASLAEVLAQASAVLPRENNPDNLRANSDAFGRLAEASRRAVEYVAPAFPESAGRLLALAEHLQALTLLSQSATVSDKLALEKELCNIYQALVLLSLTNATRVKLLNEPVSPSTFACDRYYAEFTKRYRPLEQEQMRRFAEKYGLPA